MIIAATTGTNRVRFRLSNSGGAANYGLDSSTGFGFFASGGVAYSAVMRHSGSAPLILGHAAPELTIIDGGKVGIGTTSPGSLLTLVGGALNLAGFTVATLPVTPAIGDMERVTDASAPAFGSAVAGGGSAPALVWWTGAAWNVFAV